MRETTQVAIVGAGPAGPARARFERPFRSPPAAAAFADLMSGADY